MHIQNKTKHISSKVNRIAIICEKLAMNKQNIMKLNNNSISSALNLNSEMNFKVDLFQFDSKYE